MAGTSMDNMYMAQVLWDESMADTAVVLPSIAFLACSGHGFSSHHCRLRPRYVRSRDQLSGQARPWRFRDHDGDAVGVGFTGDGLLHSRISVFVKSEPWLIRLKLLNERSLRPVS